MKFHYRAMPKRKSISADTSRNVLPFQSPRYNQTMCVRKPWLETSDSKMKEAHLFSSLSEIFSLFFSSKQKSKNILAAAAAAVRMPQTWCPEKKSVIVSYFEAR